MPPMNVKTPAKSSARSSSSSKSTKNDPKIKLSTKFKADKPAMATGVKIDRTPVNIPDNYLKADKSSIRKHITFNLKTDAAKVDPPAAKDFKFMNNTMENVKPVVLKKTVVTKKNDVHSFFYIRTSQNWLRLNVLSFLPI